MTWQWTFLWPFWLFLPMPPAPILMTVAYGLPLCSSRFQSFLCLTILKSQNSLYYPPLPGSLPTEECGLYMRAYKFLFFVVALFISIIILSYKLLINIVIPELFSRIFKYIIFKSSFILTCYVLSSNSIISV